MCVLLLLLLSFDGTSFFVCTDVAKKQKVEVVFKATIFNITLSLLDHLVINLHSTSDTI